MILSAAVLVYEGATAAQHLMKPNQGIAPSLQADFNAAQQKKQVLDKKTALIKKTIAERTQIIEVVDSLTVSRPADIWYSKIETSNKNKKNEIVINGFGPRAEDFGMVAESAIKDRPDLFESAELQKLENSPNSSQPIFILKIIARGAASEIK